MTDGVEMDVPIASEADSEDIGVAADPPVPGTIMLVALALDVEVVLLYGVPVTPTLRLAAEVELTAIVAGIVLEPMVVPAEFLV